MLYASTLFEDVPDDAIDNKSDSQNEPSHVGQSEQTEDPDILTAEEVSIIEFIYCFYSILLKISLLF